VRRTIRGAAVGGALLVLSQGCAGASGDEGAVLVRDSAGVRIIESAAPSWDTGEEWRIATDPGVAIGMLDGPREYQLQRVIGAFRNRRGQILAGNAGSNEIRVYDADGTYLEALGRPGNGPGEFERLHSLHLEGDTLYAYDLAQQRISAFDEAGDFVRSFQVAAHINLGYAQVLGRFDEGRWVLERTNWGTESGLARGTNTYSSLLEGDTTAAPIGTFPGPERIVQPVGPVGAYTRPAPYARRPTTLVSGHDLVYGGAERYELAIHDADGSLRMLVRRTIEPEPVSAGDLARWETEVEAKRPPYSPSLPAMFHQPISSFGLPEAKAAYGPVHIDLSDNYWIADYALPGHQPTEWSVFSAAGAWLGDVRSPERFRFLEIGEDYVLGVYLDELDVEYVRLYPLLK
jgi:hypothetical protein